MAWFVSMFCLKPSHKLCNSFILPQWRLLDRCGPGDATGVQQKQLVCPLQSIGYCSIAVFPLSRGQPGFPFSEGTKQHSEKTGETQLNPHHASHHFWWFLCLNPLHPELTGDSETYFTKCKIGFLAINCCALHYSIRPSSHKVFWEPDWRILKKNY